MPASPPAPKSLGHQAHRLYLETRELCREIQAQERQGAAAAGLTAVQAHALRSIDAGEGGLTMLELAHELRIRRSTATRLVDDLQVKGLVERSAGTRDRRQIRLQLLAEGRARLETHLASAERIQLEVLLRLAPSERARCLEAVHRLCEVTMRWNDAHLPEG